MNKLPYLQIEKPTSWKHFYVGVPHINPLLCADVRADVQADVRADVRMFVKTFS